MPQSATPTSVRAPIPAFPYFDLFGFRLDFLKNLSKTFKISITDICLMTRKVVSSAYAVHKKSCSKILSLPMF